MSNLIGAIICALSLAIANFGVEWFVHEVPNYMDAGKTTWSQLWAIGMYYLLWVRD